MTKKRNKTRRIKGDEQKKCMDNMCSQQKYERIYNEMKGMYEKAEKEIEKILEKKDITVEEKKISEKQLKMARKLTKKISIKKLQDICERIHCNQGCLGTIFEEGDINKLPKEVIQPIKGYDDLIDIHLKKRKEIFGKKSKVLKDNFYEGLNTRKVNAMKKKGAISGCVEYYLNSAFV